jgi:hypothetical protein
MALVRRLFNKVARSAKTDQATANGTAVAGMTTEDAAASQMSGLSLEEAGAAAGDREVATFALS